jgi:hypothetical protein
VGYAYRGVLITGISDVVAKYLRGWKKQTCLTLE